MSDGSQVLINRERVSLFDGDRQHQIVLMVGRWTLGTMTMLGLGSWAAITRWWGPAWLRRGALLFGGWSAALLTWWLVQPVIQDPLNRRPP